MEMKKDMYTSVEVAKMMELYTKMNEVLSTCKSLREREETLTSISDMVGNSHLLLRVVSDFRREVPDSIRERLVLGNESALRGIENDAALDMFIYSNKHY